MFVKIDLSTLPPVTTLHEADDLDALSVRLKAPDHVEIPIELLHELAGDLATDASWSDRFRTMIAYAERRGWVNEDGSVRAHLEGFDANL